MTIALVSPSELATIAANSGQPIHHGKHCDDVTVGSCYYCARVEVAA